MRKGFFASAAALATGAGVALGQGYPTAPPPAPPAYPTWTGGPAAAPPGGPATYPGAYPGAAYPGAYPAGPAAAGNGSMAYPGGPLAFPGGPAGYPAGPTGYPAGPADFQGGPAGPGPTDVPPADQMPLNGVVPGPDCAHPKNIFGKPKIEYGQKVGQIHKAAGGPDRWYVDIEENIWAVRSAPIGFPLLTTSGPGASGLLGVDGTRILVGDQNIDYGHYFNVFRLTTGWWDCDRRCGFELSGFVTEHRTEILDFSVPSTSQFVLARPFINAITPDQPAALLVAFPGEFSGSAHVDAHLEFYGAEANVLRNLLYCDRAKFNFLAGIRYLDLDERLEVSSTTFTPTADPNDPNRTVILDRFSTRNQFVGAQLGFQSEWRRGRYFLDATGKVALGDMREHVDIFGSTERTVTGVTTTVPGGLLAQVSNIGGKSHDEFAYVPELTLKFGYQWTQRISTYIGYNLIYLSRVVRPGDQIDPVVNPVLVPVSDVFGGQFGPVRPLPRFDQTDFWAQGATLGLSIRY